MYYPAFVFKIKKNDTRSTSFSSKRIWNSTLCINLRFGYYDASVIHQQYKRLKNAFNGKDVKLHYALKALNNVNILRLLKNEGAGLDAVSFEEIFLGLRAGFAPSDIMYTPNCVSYNEILAAIELIVHLNIDNLSILEKFGKDFGGTKPVCIRINPTLWLVEIQIFQLDILIQNLQFLFTNCDTLSGSSSIMELTLLVYTYRKR